MLNADAACFTDRPLFCHIAHWGAVSPLTWPHDSRWRLRRARRARFQEDLSQVARPIDHAGVSLPTTPFFEFPRQE